MTNVGLDTTMDFLDAEALTRLIGLQSLAIGEILYESTLLHDQISALVAEQMPPLPENLSPDELAFFTALTECTTIEFLNIAHGITILVDHAAVYDETSGDVLKIMAGWCGNPALILRAAQGDLVGLSTLPPLSRLEPALLQEQAQQISAYLLGIMPEAIRARFLLRINAYDLPPPQTLNANDQQALITLAQIVFEKREG